MTTQAQIDQLKNWYAQGGPLIAALTPDNPNPIPTPPNAGQWTEYDGAYFGSKHIECKATWKPPNQTPVSPADTPFTQYDTKVQPSPMAKMNDTCGLASWSGSLEFHRIPVAPLRDGQRWHQLDGFGQQSTGAFYPVECVRADWVDLTTGVLTDVTPTLPAPSGHPYHPLAVPTTGRKLIRIWGWIWNSMTLGRSRQFYWQGEYLYGVQSTNASWTGTNPTRQGIREWEAWWDPSGPWVHATSAGVPFDSAGHPVVLTDIVYTGWDDLGRGGGALWDYQYEGWRVGVSTINAI